MASPTSGDDVTVTGVITGTNAVVSFSANALTSGESYSLVTRTKNLFSTTNTDDTPIVAVDAPDATSGISLGFTTTEGEVAVSWQDVASTTAKPVTGYRVYKLIGAGYVQVAQQSSTSYINTGNTDTNDSINNINNINIKTVLIDILNKLNKI